MGAMQLLDNFMVGYRCAAKSAADGRTKFEVPTFLLATAAAVGQSFGISADGTLGLVTGAAVVRQGNSYFASQTKADYLNSAVDALTCIQLESVGIDGFDLAQEPPRAIPPDSDGEIMFNFEAFKAKNPEMQERFKNTPDFEISTQQRLIDLGLTEEAIAEFSIDNNEMATVEVPVQQQYFRMISGALLSVERVLARRLNHAGTPFDPAGIVAEISMLSQEAGPPLEEGEGVAQNGENMAPQTMLQMLQTERLMLMVKSDPTEQDSSKLRKLNAQIVTLEIKALQPKIQKCIILAKI